MEIWKDEKLQKSFDQAKQMLLISTQLTHPDPSLPLALRTDASQSSIGGCLEQLNGTVWEPLGFFSKHLNPAQTKYSTFKRELLAIREGVCHFINEIDGRRLTIWTDHLPIIGAFRNQDSQTYDPIAKGHIMEIANWTDDIRHVQGRVNFVADALTRQHRSPPAPTTRATLLETAALTLNFETVNHKQLAADQQICPDVRAHRQGKHVPGLALQDVEF